MKRKNAGTKAGKAYLSLSLLATVLIVAAIAFFATKTKYVQIEGLTRYSNEQFLNDTGWTGLFKNTYLYKFKNEKRPVKDIPYIDTYNIKIVNGNTLWITVYETDAIAYIDIMGECFLFDKNGVIVETVKNKPENMPLVTGFEFDEIVVFKKVKVQKQSLFDKVLSIIKLLGKYDISVDEINFGNGSEIKLTSGKLVILLGNRDSYDLQISALAGVYEKASEIGGTLDLRKYSADNTSIILR